MIAWYDLHRLFYELVALLFELLPVAVLARVDTAAEVVVLGRWRGRARRGQYCSCKQDRMQVGYSPIAICGHDIVDAELLADLFHAQVGDICVQLFRRHGCSDGSR